MTDVADVLNGTDALLLDFDGPICSVFAGYPAPQVAVDLRSYLVLRGIVEIDAIADINDPLEVLRWVAAIYPSTASDVDDVLRAAERRAISTASPTPFAHDTIRAAGRTGLPVAIASNNSEEAIGDYLGIHRLTSYVASIAGRAHGAPELMKPHPDSIERAIRSLGVPPRDCVFVGDSITDIAVSHVTGIRSVGYARTPDNQAELVMAGADVVIETMHDLVVALDWRTTLP
jgi:beta-phosphoglucomutase-like phosphatase (HAD superfamily)